MGGSRNVLNLPLKHTSAASKGLLLVKQPLRSTGNVGGRTRLRDFSCCLLLHPGGIWVRWDSPCGSRYKSNSCSRLVLPGAGVSCRHVTPPALTSLGHGCLPTVAFCVLHGEEQKLLGPSSHPVAEGDREASSQARFLSRSFYCLMLAPLVWRKQ